MASDPQILAAEAMVAAQEGLFIEPASATAVAGAGILYASGALQHDESVVVIASGTGFKDMRSALSLIPEVPRIALSVEEMMRAVEKLGA